MAYNRPHGALEYFFGSPSQTKRYRRDDDAYHRGYMAEKGRRDAKRR